MGDGNSGQRVMAIERALTMAVGTLLVAILVWFGTTLTEASRNISALDATAEIRFRELGKDVDEVRTIVNANRRTLNERTRVLENHERRIEQVERRCCAGQPKL
ncbi:MAG: hypothetical protein GY791_08380 [Alphaproteobacteria bacterium]|nr:hypothetical protein [Alphaproteobacteria bacterium]